MSTTYAQKQAPAQKKDRSTAASVLDVSSQSEGLQRKADMANNAVVQRRHGRNRGRRQQQPAPVPVVTTTDERQRRRNASLQVARGALGGIANAHAGVMVIEEIYLAVLLVIPNNTISDPHHEGIFHNELTLACQDTRFARRENEAGVKQLRDAPYGYELKTENAELGDFRLYGNGTQIRVNVNGESVNYLQIVFNVYRRHI